MREAFRQDPDDLNGALFLSRFLASQGDRKGAAAVAREAVRRHPGNSGVHAILAASLAARGVEMGPVGESWMSAAMVPVAPALFSTMIVVFHIAPSFWPMTRARMSVPPPGAKPTRRRIGPLGNACALSKGEAT